LNKKHFLFNPIWIALIMATAFAIGVLVDIIENMRRFSHYMSVGFLIYILTFLVIYNLYVWWFLGRLARLLPEKQAEIFDVRKCFLLPLKRYKKMLDAKNITLHDTVAYFLESKEVLQWIDDEWKFAHKIFVGVTISTFLFYFFELIISGWMEAVRPVILEYLSSIGLVR